MSFLKSSLLTSAFAFISLGCTAVNTRPAPGRVEIADTVFLTLPATEDITDNFNATQLLVADYGERRFSFEVELEIRPGMITIASVNMWGGTLFAITYDGIELQSQNRIDAEGLDAEFLLADVLLTYWDSDWLSDRLHGANLEDTDGNTGRAVTRDGKRVIEISYESADRWSGTTRFRHHERNYELSIDTVGFSRS